MGAIETSNRVVATPEQILSTPATPPASIASQKKPNDIENDLREAEKAAADLKAKATGEKPFEVRFVKNVNPRELIRFKDGKTFRFPASLYRCQDPKEAEKILEVAEQFGIVLQ